MPQPEPPQVLRLHARRHQHLAVILEADEAPVEQQVHVGGQHQAVQAVQALLRGGADAPGLDVAGDQQGGVVDAGDAAGALDGLHPAAELALAAAGQDDGLALGLDQAAVQQDAALGGLVELLDDGGEGEAVGAAQRQQVAVESDWRGHDVEKGLGNLSEVDRLQAVAGGRVQRAVLAGQQRLDEGPEVLRADGRRERRPEDRQVPAFVAPVGTGLAELAGLGGGDGELGDAADIGDLAVCVGQHEVARRGAPHGLVELVVGAVALALRRPQVLAVNFLTVRLPVIDPPEARHAPTRLLHPVVCAIDLQRKEKGPKAPHTFRTAPIAALVAKAA